MTHTIESLCLRSHEISKSKGWLENPRPFSGICSLIHSEISEALEDFRNNKGLNELYYEVSYAISDVSRDATVKTVMSSGQFQQFEKGNIIEAKPCGIPIELADVIIRVAQWCGTNNLEARLHSRVAYCENEHKWASRCIEDFEHFSARAHWIVSKAFEAYDSGESEDGKKLDIAEEQDREKITIWLADLVHLVFAFSRHNKIDLWAAIDEKEAFNKTRPHKHGGKKI